MKLGNRIKQFRKELRLSETAIAKQIGLSKQVIKKIEAGERKVAPWELKAFSLIFGVSVNDLLFSDTPPSMYYKLQKRKII